MENIVYIVVCFKRMQFDANVKLVHCGLPLFKFQLDLFDRNVNLKDKIRKRKAIVSGSPTSTTKL